MYCQAKIVNIFLYLSLLAGVRSFTVVPVPSSLNSCQSVHSVQVNHGRGIQANRLYMSENDNGIFDNIKNIMKPQNESPEPPKSKSEDEKDSFVQVNTPGKTKSSPGEKLMSDYKKSKNPLTSNLFSKAVASAKDTAYKTADTIENKNAAPSPDSQASKEVSKVAAKVSTNKENEAVQSMYSEDLKSSNPLTRIKAQIAIAAEERAREQRLARNRRIEKIESIKAQVFEARDSAQKTYETVVNLPSTIEKGVKETKQAIDEIGQKTRNTVEEVQKTPQKVKKAVDDTKKKVDDTKRATVEFVDDVKAIPGKVEKTVNDTKEKVERTKKGVENALSKINELSKKFSSSGKPRLPEETPTTIGEIDPGLELEVSEALDVAKQALSDNNKKGNIK